MKHLVKYSLLISFAVININSYSQGTTLFTGRLVHLNGKRELVQNVPVRLVNIGSGKTKDDGTFSIPISSQVGEVTLELENSNWSVVYPIGGKAGVPKNANTVVEFLIGESTKDILTRAIAKSNNEIQGRLKQLGLKQDGIEQILFAFRSDIQSMTDIKIADLKKEIDFESKRKEFLPRLTSSLFNYINEAKDLKDAFKFVARHAFEDPQALKVLTDAVNSYNVVFEDLNKEQKGYEESVRYLWQNDVKANEVKQLFNYALGELHSANIFTLNLKLREINEYFRGEIKGSKRKAAKEAIIRDIEAAELQLDRRLDELEIRTHEVLGGLTG